MHKFIFFSTIMVSLNVLAGPALGTFGPPSEAQLAKAQQRRQVITIARVITDGSMSPCEMKIELRNDLRTLMASEQILNSTHEIDLMIGRAVAEIDKCAQE